MQSATSAASVRLLRASRLARRSSTGAGVAPGAAPGGVAGRTSAGSSRMTARGTSGYLAAKCATEALPIEWPMRMGLSSLSALMSPARSSTCTSGRIRGGRRVGETVAARVEHDDVVAILELRRQVRPAQPIVGRAVRHHQRRLGAAGAPVVEADAVGHDVAVGPAGGRRRACRQRHGGEDHRGTETQQGHRAEQAHDIDSFARSSGGVSAAILSPWRRGCQRRCRSAPHPDGYTSAHVRPRHGHDPGEHPASSRA